MAGELTAADEIARLVDGLAARGWLSGGDALLSGYLGSAEQGPVILDAARRLRAANPAAATWAKALKAPAIRKPARLTPSM